MKLQPAYPTAEHEQAADTIVRYFAQQPDTEAVLLVNSCARGKATRDSCLDIVVLVLPEVLATDTKHQDLEASWEHYHNTQDVFRSLEQAGKFAEVHLDIIDGVYQPQERSWTGGPDGFELEVGNHIAYSVPLYEKSDYFHQLRAKWLPYYGEDLRTQRLAEVTRYCLNNLDHIPLYIERGLYFQSFDRFYNAFKEFLQALFISRRTYPIAYDKWIREQVEEILGLPELYAKLPHLFEIEHFESQELIHKAEKLRRLLLEYAPQG